jgi:RND superfamily putative drug exporter
LGSALVCVPATLALFGDDYTGTSNQPAEPALAGAPRIVAGRLAGSSTRTALAGALVVAIMALAATPLLQAKSRSFSAADLPPASEAAKVAAIAPGGPGESATAKAGGDGRSLFGELPLAAAVSAAALALILGVAFSPRAIPVALVSLLPAAAACGLCVLVFQEGHLSDVVGQRGQGALETGAVATLAAALAAVSSTRGVIAVRAARSERSLGLDPSMAAETTAAFTVPAAITSTLVAVAATAVLAATDLYPAREFGLAVAAGLVLDLLLLRVPLICAVARWGGSG